MHSVNIRQLKNNPSEAVRRAHDGPVLVLKGDHPEALLVHLDAFRFGDQGGELALALAVALYKDGAMSLGRCARLASLSIAELTSHLSRLGIPISGTDTADSQLDMQTLEQWLGSS
jgi:predicted HTH domain antitoxin